MAAVTPDSVRTQVSDRIDAAVSSLHVSPETVAIMQSPPRSPVHLEYSVDVPTTSPESDRQKPSVGVYANTIVTVVVAYQLGPKDRMRDVSAAIVVERDVRNAVMARGWTSDMSITWLRSDRSPGPVGWVWLEQQFNARHLMPLE